MFTLWRVCYFSGPRGLTFLCKYHKSPFHLFSSSLIWFPVVRSSSSTTLKLFSEKYASAVEVYRFYLQSCLCVCVCIFMCGLVCVCVWWQVGFHQAKLKVFILKCCKTVGEFVSFMCYMALLLNEKKNHEDIISYLANILIILRRES